MNPESPAGVVVLGLGAWAALLVPVFAWRLLRPQSAPAQAEVPAEDPGDDPVPGLPAEDFTDSVPFDTGVLIGPAAGGED